MPDRRPRRASSAPEKEGSAPKTRVPVVERAVAMPESMPPPPQGAMTASRWPGSCGFLGRTWWPFERWEGSLLLLLLLGLWMLRSGSRLTISFTCFSSSSARVPWPRIMSG